MQQAHGLCSPSGVCVQCSPTDTSACSGEQPICDPSKVECRGCIAHDECPSGACEYATGECFDEEVDGGCVRHVGLGQPYATVAEAIPGNANKRCLVWMHGDPGFHNESLLIDNARRIAILVEFGEDVQFDGTDGPAVTVPSRRLWSVAAPTRDFTSMRRNSRTGSAAGCADPGAATDDCSLGKPTYWKARPRNSVAKNHCTT